MIKTYCYLQAIPANTGHITVIEILVTDWNQIYLFSLKTSRIPTGDSLRKLVLKCYTILHIFTGSFYGFSR